MNPMFGIFTLAIKFHCLLLGIFKSFYRFLTLIFDELVPPTLNICFKTCFKSLFSPFLRKKKAVSVELKMWYFSNSAFWLTGQWGSYSPPPDYATDYDIL